MISFEGEMIRCWCDKGGEGKGGVCDRGGLSSNAKDGVSVNCIHPLSAGDEPSSKSPAGLDKTQIAETHPQNFGFHRTDSTGT